MRLLVTGPRTYTNAERLFQALDALNPDTVIHGDAVGADRIAGLWARRSGRKEIKRPYPEHLGRGGGVLRNKYMLENLNPTLVLACPWEADSGTFDCVTRAMCLGIPVVRLVDGL